MKKKYSKIAKNAFLDVNAASKATKKNTKNYDKKSSNRKRIFVNML